jgi:3-hydroxybutyryl-CoA dehydrogenase
MTPAPGVIAIAADAPLLVVGAGIMGAGIAQVAAQAGHPVWLLDARQGASALARDRLAVTLDGLVTKGRISADAAAGTLARIRPVDRLEDAQPIAEVRLVIEAIVEDLGAKRSLLRDLEARVSASCMLASNTSSISITALAAGLQRPGRLAGMHFFNPVPLMKLVEVVSGLHTEPDVASAIFDLATAWGKVPVHARSTPGFIVNRIARPYYAEALALLHERAAEPAVIDACLRGAGFRMGPCELMDLIGHDTNFAVTQSVYDANFGDRRYGPSVVQRELVDGGLLGRKSGRGFYRYDQPGAAAPEPAWLAHDAPDAPAAVIVHGKDAMGDRLHQALSAALEGRQVAVGRERGTDWTGLAVACARLMLTDGRTAGQVAAQAGVPDVVVFDRPLALPAAPGALAYAPAEACGGRWQQQAAAWLALLGFQPQRVADAPGLIAARTVAMLINEAADAVLQGVCSSEGADAAMKLGVNYPRGPFEWLAGWGVAPVVVLIEQLDAHYRGERYRVSPWLRRRIA